MAQAREKVSLFHEADAVAVVQEQEERESARHPSATETVTDQETLSIPLSTIKEEEDDGNATKAYDSRRDNQKTKPFSNEQQHPRGSSRHCNDKVQTDSSSSSHRHHSSSSTKYKFDIVRPDYNPNLLIDWRTHISEWFFTLVDSFKYERNTAVKALAFLDTYSMSVCFPGEFLRVTAASSGNGAEPNTLASGSSASDSSSSSSITSSALDGASDLECDATTSSATDTSHVSSSAATAATATARQSKNKKECQHPTHHRHHQPANKQGTHHDHTNNDTIGGINREKYLLAAFASFYLAAKIYQSSPNIITSSHVCNLCRRAFSVREIEDMEMEILNILKFRVNPPTALTFIRSLLPLLLPANNDEVDAAANTEEEEQQLIGTFGSCKWEPQGQTQVDIETGAIYLGELACYSSYFPQLSAAGPSKIALAAIIEAARWTFYINSDTTRQAAFQERVHGLCEIPQDDGDDGQVWASIKNAFSYDEDVKYIQSCLSNTMSLYGTKEEGSNEKHGFNKKNQCTEESLLSPVTVMAKVAAADTNVNKAPSKGASSSKQISSLFPNASRNLFMKYSKNAVTSASSLSHCKTRRSLTNNETRINNNANQQKAASAPTKKLKPCKNHRSWEQAVQQCGTEATAMPNRRFFSGEVSQALQAIETL